MRKALDHRVHVARGSIIQNSDLSHSALSVHNYLLLQVLFRLQLNVLLASDYRAWSVLLLASPLLQLSQR